MNEEEMKGCAEPARQLERLRAITHRLRAPGGCPWDIEQTHASLIPHLIEEAYEVVDAIRENDPAHLREELGDLLLQVFFHSDIAAAEDGFDLDDVARGICDKLVHRHPHVFGDATVANSESVLRQWDQIKRAERGDEDKPYLHGVGKGLPALIRAAKLQKKAAKVGFDWPDQAGVVAKIREELDEFACATDVSAATEELGDLLFSVVNLIRFRGLNPELLMAAANTKFATRFHAMETLLKRRGLTLQNAGLADMETAWQEAKNDPGGT